MPDRRSRFRRADCEDGGRFGPSALGARQGHTRLPQGLHPRLDGLGVAVAAPSVLAACGGSSQSGSSTASGGGRPVRGGTLHAGLAGGTSSDTLDAHSAVNTLDFGRLNQLYNGLVEYRADGLLSLALAEEVAPSSNASVWTIRLRPGVTFHNGKALDGGGRDLQLPADHEPQGSSHRRGADTKDLEYEGHGHPHGSNLPGLSVLALLPAASLATTSTSSRRVMTRSVRSVPGLGSSTASSTPVSKARLSAIRIIGRRAFLTSTR